MSETYPRTLHRRWSAAERGRMAVIPTDYPPRPGAHRVEDEIVYVTTEEYDIGDRVYVHASRGRQGTAIVGHPAGTAIEPL